MQAGRPSLSAEHVHRPRLRSVQGSVRKHELLWKHPFGPRACSFCAPRELEPDSEGPNLEPLFGGPRAAPLRNLTLLQLSLASRLGQGTISRSQCASTTPPYTPARPPPATPASARSLVGGPASAGASGAGARPTAGPQDIPRALTQTRLVSPPLEPLLSDLLQQQHPIDDTAPQDRLNVREVLGRAPFAVLLELSQVHVFRRRGQFPDDRP